MHALCIIALFCFATDIIYLHPYCLIITKSEKKARLTLHVYAHPLDETYRQVIRSMEDNITNLVEQLGDPSCIEQVFEKITDIFEQQSVELLPSFVSISLEKIRLIEHWIWQRLGQTFARGTIDDEHLKFVRMIAVFNMKLVHESIIEVEAKAHLLIPDHINWIDDIFGQLKTITEDDDPLWSVISCWFDPLSHLVYDYVHLVEMPAIMQINYHIEQDFIMTANLKFYLSQLEESIVPQSIFTLKQSFCMKTCLLSLKVYVYSKVQQFPYNGAQILEHIADQYARIITVQSHTIESWSPELLACIAHLNNAVASCSWWDTTLTSHVKLLIPTEDIQHGFVEAIVRIISYLPIIKQVTSEWDHHHHMLIESALLLLVCSMDVDNLSCYIRTYPNMKEILLTIAETCSYSSIYLCAYGVFVRIISDEELKVMQLPDQICKLFLTTLEQAWNHPWQRDRQIPVVNLLTRFLPIAGNDCIQHQMAKSNGLPLLNEVCDQYLITYEIVWALSFNAEIQEQLRTNASFMNKLTELEKHGTDEKIRKTVHGILWNLGLHEKQNETAAQDTELPFDIMISYAHAQKETCKQLYQELIGKGYKVWVDFDHMHGNIMDAMAHAIERSSTIIICMSEHYRGSSYCRAEACYAFQRQRRIVPVLLQQHYKPDGWLSFLLGQLLYIDFVKHEFAQAFDMLMKELNTVNNSKFSLEQHPENSNVELVQVNSYSKTSKPTAIKRSDDPKEWSHDQVSEWLTSNNLTQMAALLYDYDGRSLVYLYEYLTNTNPQQVLTLLQEDSVRRTHSTLSVIELAHFRSLFDEYYQKFIIASKESTISRQNHKKIVVSFPKFKCHVM